MLPVPANNLAKQITLGSVGLAIVLMLSALAMPTPPNVGWFEFHLNLSINLGAFTMFVGASILFLKSLKGFTPKLKRAYFLICGGMTLFALAYLQVPLLVLFDLVDDIWLNAGATLIPFLIGVDILFAGTRVFAKLIEVKGITLKYWFVITASIVLSTLIVFMPHPVFTSVSEDEFDAGQILLTVFATWIGLTAYNTQLIKRRAGLTYTSALAWFILAIGSVAFSALLVVVLSLVLPDNLQQLPLDIAYPINLLASLMCLMSAYNFNRMSYEANTTERWVARSFFGKPLQPKTKRPVSSIDIVMYAANLASNPQAIDPIMNEVRMITSDIPPNSESLVPAEKEQPLMNVYLKLEKYLAEQEKVRVFTRDELREDVAQKLQLTSKSATFWDRLPSTSW